MRKKQYYDEHQRNNMYELFLKFIKYNTKLARLENKEKNYKKKNLDN